jgi:hypothetical protein
MNTAQVEKNAARPMTDVGNIDIGTRVAFEQSQGIAGGLADDYAAGSKQAMADAGKQLADIFKGMGDIFGPYADQIKAIIAKAQANLPKDSATAEPPGAKGNARIDPAKLPSGTSHRENEVDRFARVGLFIGGAGGPAADYARKTADNTAKTNTLLSSMAASINDLTASLVRNAHDPFTTA